MARTKSPKYPNYPLSKAIENVRKVFEADRTAALPREVIAKHLGYSGLNGASDSNIATIVQYGLLERISKSEMKVTQRAVDILLSETETQKQAAINAAVMTPPLFSDIWNHFEERVPSDDALKIYLLRRGFHDRAIDPVMKSFAPTVAMLTKQKETESGGNDDKNVGETAPPPEQNTLATGAGASIGDYIQWESQGVLQFTEPRRVRWVSDDRGWLSVDESTTGIPMSEVSIQPPISNQPPIVPPLPEPIAPTGPETGFNEWFRAKVGAEKLITINYKGADDIGPREIEKMIAILEAQKLALED